MENMPPEVLIPECAISDLAKIDVWSLGCIMFELLTGYHPFREQTKIGILYRIFKTFGTPTKNILEFQTLLSNDRFTDIMRHLP